MGQFSLSGGSFTATSNTLLTGGSWSITNGPTFTHNSGTVIFSEFTGSIVPGTVQYNHVKFTNGCSYPSFNLNTGSLNVRGNLTFDSTSCSGAPIAANSGTIMAYGNVSTLGGGNGGSAVLTIAGNAGGQTISGVGSALLPPLTIAAGANAVTLSGSMAINGNYTVTSVGTFTSTGSTLIFYGSSSLQPSTLQYNNVTFASNCTYPSFNLNSSTMTIRGNLNLDGTPCSGASLSTNSGTLMAYGNVTTSGGGAAGSATLVLAGNAGGQTLTGVGGALLPPLTIAAGANPVTFSGSFNVLGNYTVTSVGAFTATGSTIAFGSTGIILPGNLTYNNVTFNSNCSYYTFDLGGTTLKVGGLLYLNGTGCGGAWFGLNSGTVMAYGNVTAGGGGNNGSVNLQFVGSGTQILSATNLTGGNVTVANTGAGKVQLASAVSLNGASQSFTVTTGSVDMAGFALTLNSLSLNAKTITRNAGVLTVGGSVVAAGTQSVYGGTVAP